MPDAVVFNEYALGGPIEQINLALGNSTVGIPVSADPGVNQDSTQGFSAGNLVFNNTPGIMRAWRCRDATPGAAKWTLTAVDYANGGTNPPIEVTQFGLSSAAMGEEGNVNRTILAAGVSPGAIGVDSVLAVYAIPLSAFDSAGRGVAIQANGSFANTVNTKTTKIIVNPATAVVGQTVGAGGTTLAIATTAGSALQGWQLNAEVYKYGAPGSNTQMGLPGGSMVANAHGGLGLGAAGAPQLMTANEAGVILIAVVGNAPTATTDISFNFMNVNALN